MALTSSIVCFSFTEDYGKINNLMFFYFCPSCNRSSVTSENVFETLTPAVTDSTVYLVFESVQHMYSPFDFFNNIIVNQNYYRTWNLT
jgi:hypothetical protein